MAETIATAYVQITPSMQGVQGELSKALGDEGKSAGSAFGSGFSGAIGGALKTSGVALAAFTGATAAASGALVNGVSDLASFGDNIDKMSQKMGLSAESYQEWEAVMQHSGTSMETMKASMKTLANAAETGNEAFELLGLSLEDVDKMSQQELFESVITQLQDVEDTTQRTYLAGKLLGRGATELGALLNTSAEDTQKMKDRVHELGGVLSDEAVKDAAAFQDSLQDMQTGFDSMSRNLLTQFLPSFTQVMDGLGNIFSGDTEQGVEQMSEGIMAVVDNVTSLVPQITQVAVPVLEAIAQGLLSNIPVIMPAMVQLVSDLAGMIISNLPLLISTGMEMILAIVNGLADAAPTLIPTVVEVMLTIVDTLLDNVDMLIDAAIALQTGLADGFIQALPILLEKAPEIINKLVVALIDNLPLLIEASVQLMIALQQGIIDNLPLFIEAAVQIISTLIGGCIAMIPEIISMCGDIVGQMADFFFGSDTASWGVDMIQGLIDGIMSMIGKVVDAASTVAGKIADYLHFSVPKLGPLSDFDESAPDMMRLFAQGIKDNENLITGQIQSSFDFGDQIKAQNDIVVDTAMTSPTYAPTAVAMPVETQNNDELSGQFAQAVSLLDMLVKKDPVEIGANADGIFDLIRHKNTMYARANGRGAFA